MRGRAVERKTVDDMCAHLRTLDIDAQIVQEDLAQKVGTGTSFGLATALWLETKESLGLIQVNGRNIGYVNIIKSSSVPAWGAGYHEEYFLEYLVLLGDTTSSLSRKTRLKKRTRHLLSGQVVDVEWQGGVLADILNGDLLLKANLVTQCRETRKLQIEIFLEPVHGCARVRTRGITRYGSFGNHAIHPPSLIMFNCLDHIAGHVANVP